MSQLEQLELFPDLCPTAEKSADKQWNLHGIFAPYNRFSMSLCEKVDFTSTHQMPVVCGCSAEAPRDIFCFYRMRNSDIEGVIPHFYTSDDRLLPFLSDPYRHLRMICNHKIVLGIDISIKPEMLIPMKIAISFYNKLIMAWWRYNGITVIPNVIVDPQVIEWCIDGYPKHSVICMNSSGIGSDPRAKQNWQIIYPHVIEELSPTLILRYGAKQPNEAEEISVYYENDNRKFRDYGR